MRKLVSMIFGLLLSAVALGQTQQLISNTPGSATTAPAAATIINSNFGVLWPLVPLTNEGTNCLIGTGTGGVVGCVTLGNLSFTGNTINASTAGSAAWGALTSGTNTSAAMVVGSGASLSASGTGYIQYPWAAPLYLNVRNYGAKLDGTTDDSAALVAAVTAANNAWAATNQRACVYIPATNPTMYLNGASTMIPFSRYFPGCVEGDGGDFKSVIQLGSAFAGSNSKTGVAGDLFAWSDAFVSANGQTADLNSPLSSGGPTVRNIEVFGYKGGSFPASSSVQNAFMMYDATDFAFFDNVGCYWVSGSCLMGGRIKNNTFSFIRESMLNNIRINKSGNTTIPTPNIDIYSDCSGACIGGTNADYKNGSNQVDIVNVRDYAAEGTGISIINNNQNSGANARKIRIVNLTIEGDQTQGSPQQTGYLMQLGSTSALGKYNSIYLTNAHFLSPYDGYGAVSITSRSGLIPYDIRCNSCGIETGAGAGGGRSGTGLGLNIQSGYNIYWGGSDFTSPGTNVTVGPTSGGTCGSGQITFDGQGSESGWTTSIDSSATSCVQSVVYKSDLSSTLAWPGPIASTNTSADTLSNGTYGQRPGSPTAGQLRYNSTSGSYEMYSGASGSGWRPFSGVATIPGCVWASQTPATTTGSTSETNLKACTIPANMLGGQAMLRITAMWDRSATTTDTVGFEIRHSTTSGATSGTVVMSFSNSVSGIVNLNTVSTEWITGVSAQMMPPTATNNTLALATSASTFATGTTTSTNASYLNFNCTNTTSSADTCGIYAYSVELVTP